MPSVTGRLANGSSPAGIVRPLAAGGVLARRRETLDGSMSHHLLLWGAVPFLLCALCVPLGSQQIAPPESTARVLPPSETLHFTVEWKLITAGRARLSWSGQPSGGWQTLLRIESAGLVSKLFKVQDDFKSTFAADLCAAGSELMASEGARRRDTRITYNRDTLKAHYLERDLVKNTIVLEKETDIPGCVYDIVGALYHLRTLNLEPGQTVQLPVSDGKKSVSARIEAQTREEIKTPAGVRKTIRYEAFLFNNVLYQRQGRVFIWLTDDRQRVPVQIRVRLQFHIGTITLLLEKEERP